MRLPSSRIFNQTLKLAVPISLARVLEVSMNTVDTIMVGRLGKDALAAVGIALPLWNLLGVFFFGTLYGLAPLVGRSMKQRRFDEMQTTILSAKWLCLCFFIVTSAVFASSAWFFRALSQPPDLIAEANSYLFVLLIGIPAVLVNQILRQLFELYQKPRITVMISIVGFGLNILGNYLFIYGKCGFPRWEIFGSALSTSMCWIWMCAAHLICLKYIQVPFSVKKLILSRQFATWKNVRLFLKQGLPLGSGMAAEVGFFALTAWMVGQLGKIPLASHSIAINLASMTFMFAIGTSNATTILISQAGGIYQRARVFMYSLSGTLVITIFMSLTAILFVVFPGFLVSLYTSDPDLMEFAPKLLLLAGMFQIVDGLQAVGFGILRGMSEAKAAFKNTVVAYWLLGVPAGFLLGHIVGMGAQGFWVGLNFGLASAAFLHYVSFRKKLRERAF